AWTGTAPNHIASIVDNNASLNRKVAFTYDTNGQLTDIDWTTAGAPATDRNEHFEYQTIAPLTHWLTGMRDPRGIWITQAYDSLGRVSSQTVDPLTKNPSGLNRSTGYDYSVPGQVTITDPAVNGVSSQTTEVFAYGTVVSVTRGPGKPEQATWLF